jgi:hypothetical protein
MFALLVAGGSMQRSAAAQDYHHRHGRTGLNDATER